MSIRNTRAIVSLFWIFLLFSSNIFADITLPSSDSNNTSGSEFVFVATTSDFKSFTLDLGIGFNDLENQIFPISFTDPTLTSIMPTVTSWGIFAIDSNPQGTGTNADNYGRRITLSKNSANQTLIGDDLSVFNNAVLRYVDYINALNNLATHTTVSNGSYLASQSEAADIVNFIDPILSPELQSMFGFVDRTLTFERYREIGDLVLGGSVFQANGISEEPVNVFATLDSTGTLTLTNVDSGNASPPALLFVDDLDNDGFQDGMDTDIDGDGIPNNIEITNGLNSNSSSDGAFDLDGDGWSNADEYRFGTNINDANDNPSTLANLHQKVFAEDGEAGDIFGQDIALDGNTAVIGAFSEDTNGVNVGAVYIYTQDIFGLWQFQAKLVADDGAAGDVFGIAVDVDQDTVVVGARDADISGSNSGAAYVFTRSGDSWTQQAKLVPSDPASGYTFGSAVSVDGDTALIAARGDDSDGTDSGSAYVFTRTGTSWSQQTKLAANDATANVQFGWALSLENGTALIGARLEDTLGVNAGAAYVFTGSGNSWSQQAKLTGGDTTTGDEFGFSVSLSGDTALIGARFDDDVASKSGSAYIFIRSGTNWTEQQKITSSTPALDDEFGASVALEGDVAIIGERLDDGGGSNTGTTYLFTRDGTTWSEQNQFVSADADAGDEFGVEVALSGETALIGAINDDDLGTDAGAVYFFNTNMDLDGDGLLPGIDADIDGDGIPNSIETTNGLDPNDPTDGALDLDGDGWSNVDEYRFGTDINDSNDNPLNQTNPHQKVFASDGAAGDEFGLSVSVSGDTAVISAPNDDEDGFSSGSVYIYTRDLSGLWNNTQKLNASDRAAGDEYGVSIFIAGDTILIGAPKEDDNGNDSGAVYIYTRDGNGVWGNEQKITASDGAADDRFGESVSLFGDTALVGAYGQDAAGILSGSAYIYTRDTNGVWGNEQKLNASDGSAGDLYGESVSIHGDTVMIGARGDDDGASESGSVYIYTQDVNGVWGNEQKLTASDGAPVDLFGSSVSVYGDIAVIGAPEDDDNGLDSGSIYVYSRDVVGVWGNEQKLTASDGAILDQFGLSVSISNNTLLVGTQSDDGNGSFSGSVYAYIRGSTGVWGNEEKIIASDGAADDRFGWGVSIDGDTAVIGAIRDDDNGTDSGSAYFFELDIQIIDLDSDGIPDIEDADIDGDGIPNSVETANGLNPNDASDGTLDLDSDGWTNVDEYRFGTGINDVNSNPANQTNPHQKVFAGDGAANDRFGWSVSIDGDSAVIGVVADDDNGIDSGSAYVFRRDGNGVWTQQAKLIASDALTGDNFGWSVSINGDTAVIGARFNDDNGPDSGSAYVFTRDGNGVWTEEAKLIASDAAAGDFFGASVSIEGDTAVIGAYLDDDNGSASGSAYVFTRDGNGVWTEEAKLIASDAAAGDQFGWSVSIEGDTAVIGAYLDDDNGSSSGSAYVFTRDGNGVWTEQAKLTASDGAAVDHFGLSVSIDGDTAIIGGYLDDDNGSDSGSAYVFTRDSNGVWTEQAKLTASDGAVGDQFGLSVSIKGDAAVIGAHRDDDNGTDSGSAYVFTRDSNGVWTEQAKLIASDAADVDLFGWSVSIEGDAAVIGAVLDNDNGSNSGSAYFFDLDLDDDGILDFNDADIDGDGIPNTIEQANGLNERDASDGSLDLDNDTWSNADEYRFGTNINDANDNPSSLTNLHQKVFSEDGEAGDVFGQGIAIDGDTAVIGAWLEDDNATDAGAAYIYTQDANGLWNFQTKLVADDGETEDAFGVDVSIDGDTVVIGAWLDDNNGLTNSGSAYVFTRNGTTWSQQAKLLPADQGSNDLFGRRVSIDADTVVIGARDNDDFGSNSGSAYVFTRNGTTWTQQAKLLPNDGASGDNFGRDISIEGNTVAVGALFHDNNGIGNSGSVYVYTRNGTTWSLEQKLGANDPVLNDQFGWRVSLSGNTLLIGANGVDDNGSFSGAAYVFTRSGTTWSQQQKLLASDGSAESQFGRSVSVEGDIAIIGAHLDDENGTNTGSVYVFTRSGSTWTEVTKFVAADGDLDDVFGIEAALSGETALIGAINDDDLGTDSGAAYFFTIDIDLDDDGIPDANDADIDGDGIPNSVEITVGLNPDDASDGILDLDGDGWSNVDEYRFGTDINDINDNPANQTNPHQKVFAGDGIEQGRFAYSLSISDNTALIGVPSDDDFGSNTGSAYVFIRDGSGVWAQQAKLTASDAAANDYFGLSVSISGDIALIGSYWDDDNGSASGSAYVFTRDATGAWTQETKLIASDGATFDQFGYSVSVSGEIALIGAIGDDDNFGDSGSAYIFKKNINGAWFEEAKLIASDGALSDRFGASVSLDNEIAVIGTQDADDTDIDSVYVFNLDTNGNWLQKTKLLASDGSIGDRFGESVSISGDTILVGARGDDDNGSFSGSAYVFTLNNGIWNQQAKLTASDGLGGDSFGISVSISDNKVVVGAWADNGDFTDTGSAYIFIRDSNDTWLEKSKIIANDQEASDGFGHRVSIFNDIVLINARDDDDTGLNSGSAYFFDLDRDNDGLLNSTEVNNSTDALDPDTDDDGLLDGGASPTCEEKAEYCFGSNISLVEQLAPANTTSCSDTCNDFAQFNSVCDLNQCIANCEVVFAGIGSTCPAIGNEDINNNGLFDLGETNPRDIDSDDDGLADGVEDANQNGIVDAGETDPTQIDTDADGLQDGTELGLTVGIADPDDTGPLLGTDTNIFQPDMDPSTTTDPLNPDSDGDGLVDGSGNSEDINDNGMVDPGETDAMDADSDDDGIPDGMEDINANQLVDPGETDPTNADTDGDGIQDGTELGYDTPVPDPDGAGPLQGTDTNIFIPDSDPSTTTSATNPDSDGDGFTDGQEDPNGNGSVDQGESNPGDGGSTPGSVTPIPLPIWSYFALILIIVVSINKYFYFKT